MRRRIALSPSMQERFPWRGCTNRYALAIESAHWGNVVFHLHMARMCVWISILVCYTHVAILVFAVELHPLCQCIYWWSGASHPIALLSIMPPHCFSLDNATQCIALNNASPCKGVFNYSLAFCSWFVCSGALK